MRKNLEGSWGRILSPLTRGGGGELVGRVTRGSDGDALWGGDTLWVTDAMGVRAKVRLDRIDAPESDQPWGRESTAYLKGLVDGKSVKVEWRKHDQYGRCLGIIWFEGRDTNLHMVETGNAWHYSYYDKTPAYAAAEVAAREAKKGLWAAEGPINPYRWRKGDRTAAVRETGRVMTKAGAFVPLGPVDPCF